MRTKYTEEFEAFWGLYPRRWIVSSGVWVKIGKRKAFRVWSRLSKDDHSDIMAVIKRFREGKFVPDAWRWLRDVGWEDFDVAPRRPPDKQDPELIASDKRQKAVAKLTKTVADNLKG